MGRRVRTNRLAMPGQGTEVLKLLEGAALWLDRSGLALLIGFLLGALAAWLLVRNERKKLGCYYGAWIDQQRGEARLVAIVGKERQRWIAEEGERRAAELIEADRKKHGKPQP